MRTKDIEPDETITVEESREILPDTKIQKVSISFRYNSVVLEPEGANVVIEFVSLSDGSPMEKGQNNLWTTVSRYLIHKGDKTYEVETDGPFELSLEGSNISEVIMEDGSDKV